MKLANFDNSDFDRGRARWIETYWRFLEGLIFNSWLPGSSWRIWLLRRFGATVGMGVTIKPHVRVKFPWKLKIGNYSWIGESVWIDNLADVSIGNDCCISQGTYICTGSHRWDRESFDLITKPIYIEDKCWVGAMVRIGPGVTMEEGSVISLGSQTSNSLRAWQVYTGNPAKIQKKRQVNTLVSEE